jgi:hypothetical protein
LSTPDLKKKINQDLNCKTDSNNNSNTTKKRKSSGKKLLMSRKKRKSSMSSNSSQISEAELVDEFPAFVQSPMNYDPFSMENSQRNKLVISDPSKIFK